MAAFKSAPLPPTRFIVSILAAFIAGMRVAYIHTHITRLHATIATIGARIGLCSVMSGSSPLIVDGSCLNRCGFATYPIGHPATRTDARNEPLPPYNPWRALWGR